jgi:hypothetical protein
MPSVKNVAGRFPYEESVSTKLTESSSFLVETPILAGAFPNDAICFFGEWSFRRKSIPTK